MNNQAINSNDGPKMDSQAPKMDSQAARQARANKFGKMKEDEDLNQMLEQTKHERAQAKADRKLQRDTLVLYLAFWTMMIQLVEVCNVNLFQDLITNILIWVQNNVPVFAMPAGLLIPLVPLFPLASIWAYLHSAFNAFKHVNADGVPTNYIMHMNYGRIKLWVKALDEKTLKTLLLIAGGPAPQPGNPSRRRRRRRAGIHKHTPPSNMCVMYCVDAWNSARGSSSTQGTKRKFILPSAIRPNKKVRSH